MIGIGLTYLTKNVEHQSACIHALPFRVKICEFAQFFLKSRKLLLSLLDSRLKSDNSNDSVNFVEKMGSNMYFALKLMNVPLNSSSAKRQSTKNSHH